MSSLDFSVLTPTQLSSRSTKTFRAGTSAQIKALTGPLLAAFSKAQLSSISPGSIGVLSSSQFLALSTTQLSGLVANQIGSSAELKRLTPLALDHNSDGIHSVSAASGVVFDVNADGQSGQVGWLSAGDAWLALDRNGNGLIDDCSELFGCGTRMSDGSKALDGFAALRMLDNNQDGASDADDSSFDKLLIWVDSNLNANVAGNPVGRIRDFALTDVLNFGDANIVSGLE